MNFGSCWFSDKIVLKMYNAQQITREIHPALYGTVERPSGRAGFPMPNVYTIPDNSPMPMRDARDARPATAHMCIVNPLTGGGLMALLSTHPPPMDERISRLEALAPRTH